MPSLRAVGRSIALATLLSIGAFAVSADAGESKIAFVDVQRAVMATEDGMRAQATLKKLFDKRQADLDAKQSELTRARDDIEKQSRVVSREVLQKRMEDWQARMVRLQTDFVEYNKELQRKQGELTAPIIRKMMATIARLAKKNGYEAVLDKQATAYVRPDLELTEQVIQLYNTGGGSDEEKKPDAKDGK
jgi:outer membrane protein